jgi:hypothetical protein
MDEKIDKLINLVEHIENITFDEVVEKILRDGFSHYHFYFLKYLNDEKYVDVTYDSENRIVSLVDINQNVSEVSEQETQNWKQGLKKRGKKISS